MYIVESGNRVPQQHFKCLWLSFHGSQLCSHSIPTPHDNDTMKLLLQSLLFISITSACASTLRHRQESKLFHFIPASEFTAASDGIVLEDSSEGTVNLAELKSGDFIHYPMQMPMDESYLLQVRLASPTGGGSFDITNADTGEVYATFDNLPASGSWQRYSAVSRFVYLPAGEYNLSVDVRSGGFNLLWLYFKQQDGTQVPTTSQTATTSPVSTPIGTPVDAPVSTPGSDPVMEPVNPPVVSSSPPVTSPISPPIMSPIDSPVVSPVENPERKWAMMINAADYTAMEGVEVEVSSEGIQNVAFLDPGDYLEYLVDFPMAGKYRVSISVASPNGDGAFEVDVGTQRVVAFTDILPVTGDWQNYETITLQLEVGTTGLVPIRINVLEQGWNILWLYFYHDMMQQ